MNPKAPPPPAPGITMGDICYILFRHKRLIIILTLVAAVAAVAVRVFWPVPYQSEAELLVKYVTDIKPPDPNSADTHVTSPDSLGENIISSEIAILDSMNLAEEVAKSIGSSNIMGKAVSNDFEAAAVIRKSLTTEVGKRSDVIGLVFSHRRMDMVQPVLNQIIDSYLRKHNEIHRPHFNEFLTTETDELKHKLEDTESQLMDAQKKVGIPNLDEGRKTFSEKINNIQNKIDDAVVELAGDNASIMELRKLVPQGLPGPDAGTASNSSATAAAAAPPPSVMADYRDLLDKKNRLDAEVQKLHGSYPPGSSMVKAQESQLAGLSQQEQTMEAKYPALFAVKPTETKSAAVASGPGENPKVVYDNAVIKARDTAARLGVLTNLLAGISANAGVLTSMEGRISELERDRTSEEADLNYYRAKLEQSRADDAIGQGNSNISIVETPTPPIRDMLKLTKNCLGIFFGGLALALALPFVIELYLDRSLKHPLEVQSRLGLPFFISIPLMNGNGHGRGNLRKLLKEKTIALLPAGEDEAGESDTTDTQANGAEVNGREHAPAPDLDHPLAVWERSHGLQAFYETLRDRLMTYFEMINLTHKPKLVAVTSCEAGAGVTTTAAGLASSLSETGEGNVLLVNMNNRDGEAHHFYRGKLSGLDEAVEKGAAGSEPVQGRLYVAREQAEDESLPRVLPKRFSHLLPKMKASEFDYIIFDMPPVSQISITPRLARFMDMVLVVIESGKTDRDLAKRVTGVLSDTKTNVGIVLNKNRSYGPRRLHHEV